MRRRDPRLHALTAALIAVLVVMAPHPIPALASDERVEAVAAQNDRWIVTLRPAVRASNRAEGIAKAAGGQSVAVFKHVLNGFVFKGSARAVTALDRNPDVRTIVKDQPVQIAAETLPSGIRRLNARHPTEPDAHEEGYTGSGARVAILDTGIDLTHLDLAANLDIPLGIDCYSGGEPQDGHGHGTHVAGTVAAAADNGIGVVGVAPSARLVPVKVLSDAGTGEWSHVICGIDHITGLVQDDDPSNDVHVANMSLGDAGEVGRAPMVDCARRSASP